MHHSTLSPRGVTQTCHTKSVPLVSVILPVFNGAEYLESSISSILNQSLVDLELVIIDDGSTDASREIINAADDARIVRIFNDRNFGLPKSLNIGISRASADFIARHDQDDEALTDRLSAQVTFLQNNASVGLVGTWSRIDGDNSGKAIHQHPVDDSEIRWRLLWNSPFVHSSVMMRRACVVRAGGYSEDPERWIPEDYDLWVRMANFCRLANLPQVLQIYRSTANGLSRKQSAETIRGVMRISSQQLAKRLPHSRSIDIEGLVRALNGYTQPTSSLIDLWRRLSLFHQASRDVEGFAIRRHTLAYAYTLARISRNSLLRGA